MIIGGDIHLFLKTNVLDFEVAANQRASFENSKEGGGKAGREGGRWGGRERDKVGPRVRETNRQKDIDSHLHVRYDQRWLIAINVYIPLAYIHQS